MNIIKRYIIEQFFVTQVEDTDSCTKVVAEIHKVATGGLDKKAKVDKISTIVKEFSSENSVILKKELSTGLVNLALSDKNVKPMSEEMFDLAIQLINRGGAGFNEDDIRDLIGDFECKDPLRDFIRMMSSGIVPNDDKDVYEPNDVKFINQVMDIVLDCEGDVGKLHLFQITVFSLCTVVIYNYGDGYVIESNS